MTTTSTAKQAIRTELARLGLPAYRLTARTVGFSDLARGERIFVFIHGWKPSPAWAELKGVARDMGFCIEAGT